MVQRVIFLTAVAFFLVSDPQPIDQGVCSFGGESFPLGLSRGCPTPKSTAQDRGSFGSKRERERVSEMAGTTGHSTRPARSASRGRGSKPEEVDRLHYAARELEGLPLGGSGADLGAWARFPRTTEGGSQDQLNFDFCGRIGRVGIEVACASHKKFPLQSHQLER